MTATAALDTTVLAGALDGLAARQLVRALPGSTMAGEREYAFWHVLARDVAYGSLPRRERIDAHLAVADWIRGAAAGRTDVAVIVAHHVGAAMDLAAAAHDAERVEAIRPRAMAAFADAAAATHPLDAGSAVALYRRALDLAPAGTPERADLLYRYGRVLSDDGAFHEAAAALDEAQALFEAAGDTFGSARALSALRLPLILLDDDRWRTAAARAVKLLEPLGPSEDLVAAYTERAISGFWASPPTPALEDSQRAIEMAAALGLPAPTMALQIRAQARMGLGDLAGFDDFVRAFEEAVASGRWAEAVGYGANHSAYRFFHEGPTAALAIDRELLQIAEAHGMRAAALTRRLGVAAALWLRGDVAEAEGLLDQVESALRPGHDGWAVRDLVGGRLEIALARGDLPAVRALMATLAPFAELPSAVDTGLHSVLAAAHLALDEPAEARRRLSRALELDRSTSGYWTYLALTTRVALALGDLEAARDVSRGVSGRAAVQRCGMASNDGLVAEADGRPADAVIAYARAAEAWTAFGVPLEAAYAELGAGRCLAALGRTGESRERLAAARDTAARIDAGVIVREADEVLAQLGDAPGWSR